MNRDQNKAEKPDNFSLVRRPTSAVEKAAPGAKRILSGMVADALVLIKKASSLRIIAVNDEWGPIESIKIILQKCFNKDAEILTFDDSEKAWQELLRTDPDLLITDDIMPALGGMEIVRRLANRKAAYPVILTTSFERTELLMCVRDCASRGLKIKLLNAPWDVETFLKAVQDSLKIPRAIARSDAKTPPVVADADTVANMSALSRFRLGGYEWCEPDYRQILAWSDEMCNSPQTIIQCLVEKKSSFADGRLVEVHWDVDSMPVKKFSFVPGLKIKVFSTEWSELAVFNNLNRNLKLSDFKVSEINLEGLTELEVLAVSGQNLKETNLRSHPKLKQIICESNELASLDLSGCHALEEIRARNNSLSELELSNLPALKSLDCRQNRLSVLDLSGAPALEFLDCRENLWSVGDYDQMPSYQLYQMDVLDITPLKNLKVLKYDVGKTRLIQRADQKF